jgi:hypothetical protein
MVLVNHTHAPETLQMFPLGRYKNKKYEFPIARPARPWAYTESWRLEPAKSVHEF